MKTLIIGANKELQFVDKPKPDLTDREVLVKVRAAAINRRDQWIREGKYPNISSGVTLGSDASGQVESVNNEGDEQWIGKEVILNPNIDWGDNPDCQSDKYSILGMPVDGTFAEYVKVPHHRLIEKPQHLSSEQASSLPLAGLTAFRALFRYRNVDATTKILISGFGGGVGQFAGIFAIHSGAQVYVTSGSEVVRDKALELGANNSFNYREENWASQVQKTVKGFDLIIDSAGGDQVNSLIKLLAPGGKIVFYGATNGLPKDINLYQMFWKQVALQGTSMGNDKEFSQMVKFVADHNIEPLIGSVRPFDEAEVLFDEMASGDRFGKSVLTF